MTNFYNDIYINNKYSLLCSTKFNPIVKYNVDKCIDDYYVKKKTIELAESEYQVITINGLLAKSNITKDNVNLLISGDLQNQILASTLASSEFGIPTFGIYSACASFVEGLIIASNMTKSNTRIIVSTSSHNLVSEKQFRYPVEYGAVRKSVNTCTNSSSVSVLISQLKSNIRIESSTIGKVVKTNHKDTNDMGSAMAPSCALTIFNHLKSTNRNENYYDLILTGDLGKYGVQIMNKYYEKLTGNKLNRVIDSGSIFYKDKNIFAGSSGPVCLPLILFDYIIPLKKYKKILIVGTGSLHSVISSNLLLPIPSISHAISLEVEY